MRESGIKCGICQLQDAKYKCPKCGIRYCSLKCFKDELKHNHNTVEKKDEVKEANKSEQTAAAVEVKSGEFGQIYNETPELKELLKYNTVKFHLSKVYRILNTNTGNGGSLSTEMKNQLAIDYLNTLRYGGVHYNEAIEEFCQICLRKLETADTGEELSLA
ncbi:Hit1p NDAI_0B01130 [Naumovozyma dairenensis CBS 421]|uniref:HIT-type domain-containing protein n=1 Tax=Naumovozyma dairenensis (strain ATCC 10597 / BCRC 20456 / CBS 421 / NBRC 0211 / NRRL Y-12639) TaxID=1071378 RepID=G0W5T6_NAUDC|nr:hypothetical protein NDAI_0B01130 [Naumovozyma dairenensis CBS 421]CCD23147.1 hypothetical protein NDAI_0B01130 [Naumovozyma dairenensis CBS 421]